MIAFGKRFGATLRPGDVVALSGELGAGKTHLVKGIAAAWGVDPDTVSSPTFTIAHEYAGRTPVHHLDLYRLSGLEDARRVGLDAYFVGEGICVVEWPERVPELFPEDTLVIRMRPGPDGGRVLELRP